MPRHPALQHRWSPVTHTGISDTALRPAGYVRAVTRTAIGWIFLWAFLDETFGWGFATPANRAWLSGGGPTTGFLKGAGESALGGFFAALAGQAWVDSAPCRSSGGTSG